jgi:hypothetical protein
MNGNVLTIRATPTKTQLLLTSGADELMRAVLPPIPRHQGVATLPLLLRALASWLDARLHVVLSADVSYAWSHLGLTDELNCPINSLFYTVEVLDRATRPRAARRLRGVGDFRQLHLLRRVVQDGGAS